MALDKVLLANPVAALETIALGLDAVTDEQVRHQFTLPIPLTLTSSTTPPVTKVWSDTIALSGGALTLDLQALVNANLPNVDFTGLKIQILYLSNPIGNGILTITPGAANDYDLGGASMSWTLNAGDALLSLNNDSAPDVAAADSELDFAGTGTEEFDILIVAG